MRLCRRYVLAGFGAMVTAAALPVPLAEGALAPFRRKLGAIDVTVISDGTLNTPLSLALPETPGAETAALFAAHGLSPEGHQPQINVSLIKTGNELVLIDAGSGSNFQATAGKLAENMEAAGIDPASVTKVVFTHAHADHLWGVIDDFDDGDRFPNASYVISPAEWDFWRDPDTPAKLPDQLKGMARGSARILKRIEAKVERRRGGDMVAPGVTYVETIGHTPGHMAVMVESEGQRLLIGGDVLMNVAVSFARPGWRVGSDYDHDQGVATRMRLLDLLVTERLPLVGFHLPWPGYGMVERSGMAYRFIPR